MTARARIVAFGSAALLVIAGVACAAAIGGGVGQYLAFALIGLGLVAVVSLVFMEVGLSEDRELEREQRKLEREQRKLARKPRRRQRPRLGRSRGENRRLS